MATLVGRCKELVTKIAQRGLSENVNELLNWASFTHGQNYQMRGFTQLQLLLGRNPPQQPELTLWPITRIWHVWTNRARRPRWRRKSKRGTLLAQSGTR